MDAAARGKKALAAGDYEGSVKEYTKALETSPTSPDYLIQRSTAHQRSKNYPVALADANNAVINAHKRAKRELIVEAQFRRGCALHSLERYGDAEFVFGVVKRMDEKHKMVTMFDNKNKMALDRLAADDPKKHCTVKELPSDADLVASQTPPASINENSVSAPATTSQVAQASTSGSAPVHVQIPAQPQQTPADKIRYEWYQNTEYLYFTLLAKGVPKDKAQVDIQERSISISFPLVTGSSYDLTLEPLYAALKPEGCIIRILPTKIELVLKKATPGQKWSALESSERVATNATPKDTVVPNASTHGPSSCPAYPTSSKSGPKNWDKIVKEARRADSANAGDSSTPAADDDDDDIETGDPANAFFQKLYKGASPDTQRAMMKSYIESNGTALSTNWEEVSKAKVETVPPDGMEAREYEK